jgi:uncharacterized protein (TIGR00106 family)
MMSSPALGLFTAHAERCNQSSDSAGDVVALPRGCGSKEEITMVLLEFSMTPLGEGESVSAYVARSLDIIDKSGLPYQLTPMGTIIEGEWPDVMAVVTACFEAMQSDCVRITTQIKIDYRKGPAGRLKSKVDTVQQRLGRKLST